MSTSKDYWKEEVYVNYQFMLSMSGLSDGSQMAGKQKTSSTVASAFIPDP